MPTTVLGACADAVDGVADASSMRPNDTSASDEAGYSAVIGDAEYRYTVDASGNASIVSCATEAEALEVPARIDGHAVVAIADEAFSAMRSSAARGAAWGAVSMAFGSAGAFSGKRSAQRNTQLEHISLPEGVASIGRGAFRGCKALREINLPASLREIADFAFSCTAISSLRIPAACTEISPRALWTGPEALPGVHSEYRSSLQDVQVNMGNPCFRVIGGTLCRRRDDGAACSQARCEGSLGEQARDTAAQGEGAPADSAQAADALGTWEVVLAPGRAARASVPDRAEISEDAFCGVDRIDALSVPDGVRIRCKAGLLPGGLCDCLEIRFPDLPEPVVLAFNDDAFARTVLNATKGMEILDGAAIVRAYDNVLDDAQQGFDPARLMAARLAAPALLDERLAASFHAKLECALESLCAHFGARAQWEGFELLADAGLLGEADIERVVDALGVLGDAAAVSHLLSLKRRRYGKAAWAYEL